MKCPFCSGEIEEVSKFCIFCGKRLPEQILQSVCRQCGQEIFPGQKFCTSCGMELTAPSIPQKENITVKPVPVRQDSTVSSEAENSGAEDKQAQKRIPREACVGVGIRFLAVLVDGLMLLVLLYGIIKPMGLDMPEPIVITPNFKLLAFLREFVKEPFVRANLILFFIYYFALETGFGATIGKMVFGLRVLKKNGEKCTGAATFIRTLFRVIEVNFTFYLLSAILVSLTPLKQRLGDLFAGTVVVSVRKLKKTSRSKNVLKQGEIQLQE